MQKKKFPSDRATPIISGPVFETNAFNTKAQTSPKMVKALPIKVKDFSRTMKVSDEPEIMSLPNKIGIQHTTKPSVSNKPMISSVTVVKGNRASDSKSSHKIQSPNASLKFARSQGGYASSMLEEQG